MTLKAWATEIQVTLNLDELIAVRESLRISSNVCEEDYRYGHLDGPEELNFKLWKDVSPKFQQAIQDIKK